MVFSVPEYIFIAHFDFYNFAFSHDVQNDSHVFHECFGGTNDERRKRTMINLKFVVLTVITSILVTLKGLFNGPGITVTESYNMKRHLVVETVFMLKLFL